MGLIRSNSKKNRPNSPKRLALVAFVIDDWGYNKKNLDFIFQIKKPLTISVLPNLPYSNDIAEAVKNSGAHNMILHLPLEAVNNTAPSEKNTITCAMSGDEILSILDNCIKSLPGIDGVSNHQGSKATGDKEVMKVILSELNKRNLFFLDSRTSSKSVCGELARAIGLKSAERDVFLDMGNSDESYTKKQIEQLAAAALKNGSAVGIGHDKTTTLKAIMDSIPELEKMGIEIVALKNLVK
jgi:uncharacterized protein